MWKGLDIVMVAIITAGVVLVAIVVVAVIRVPKSNGRRNLININSIHLFPGKTFRYEINYSYISGKILHEEVHHEDGVVGVRDRLQSWYLTSQAPQNSVEDYVFVQPW